MFKNIFSAILLAGMMGFMASQTVRNESIIGKILQSDGTPLSEVPVEIPELNMKTLTDESGTYKFFDVKAGDYHIKIQVIGAKEESLPVHLSGSAPMVVDYRFQKENISAIQEVVLPGKVNKFSHKESYYVAKLPLKNIENPQVYISVPKELIQEQIATSLGEISKNVPGSGIPMLANQGRVTFLSRGFTTEPMVRNGISGFAYTTIDPVNLEKIEAVKGPSATLFGSNLSTFGGIFNRVTKKPYNGFGGEIGYTAGSWNFNRLTMDVNTPVNNDKTVLFRLNGAGTFQKSFQDLGFTNNISVAPSISYQVTDRLSLLFDVEYGHEKGTSVLRFNPYLKSNKIQSITDMQLPYNKLFGSNDMPYQTELMNIFAQMNYKISDQWLSQTVLSRARSTINGYITAVNAQSDTTALLQAMIGNTNFIATNIQQNFIGDFRIFGHRNRLIIGIDYYNNANSFDRVTVNGPVFNFVHPDAKAVANRSVFDNLAATGTPRLEKDGDNSYAAYASDVFNITDRFLAMMSLRADRYQNLGSLNIASNVNSGAYWQTNFSPKLGLVYILLQNKLSLFANYMNGFTNQAGADFSGNTFKPIEANQSEFGLKADIFNHRLVGTVSYYNIDVKNMVRQDPVNSGYSLQDGGQLSKGVELELTANPFTGFNIIGGYAYNDSKMTRANPNVEGLRPALSGPSDMYNLWASYLVSAGMLKGFGIGFGGNKGNKSYQTNTTTAKVIIPAYTTLDAEIHYESKAFRVGLKINNITDEKTWSVRLTPQNPTQVLGNVSYKF